MKKAPAIFYVPHPDDEAIGMGGFVQFQRAEGRAVHLVLLTNGANQKVLNLLNGTDFCNLHKTRHSFGLSMDDLCASRRLEFFASAERLRVDAVHVANHERGFSDPRNDEPAAQLEELTTSIRAIMAEFAASFPGASHHTTSGPTDVFTRGGTGKPHVQPAHQASWQAARSLHKQIPDFIFHRVYAYLRPAVQQPSPVKLMLRQDWQVLKRAALDEYRRFHPDAGRYAIGAHSVGPLIEAAYDDPIEYADTIRS